MLQNAFGGRLADAGFEITEILTVDILHEVELGVWKAVLVHLIRVLHSYKADLVKEMNERFEFLFL